jgi:hypothetical protein
VKLLAVIVLVAACSRQDSGRAPGECRPFSVTAPGDQSEVQPVWAGDSWAIARQGVYVHIDEAGAVTEMSLPDLPLESFAYDGVELGYYVAKPQPHIALFTPGDVSTLHASPSFTVDNARETASVRGDPSGAPRIDAYFTDEARATHHWSDGTVGDSNELETVSIALAPGSTVEAFADYRAGGLGEPGRFNVVVDGPVSGSVSLDQYPSPTLSATPQLVASDNVAIARLGDGWGTWKISADATAQIETPPIAWSGDAFVSFDQGALRLYDHDYQPTQTRPLDVTDTVLLGVGATPERSLLVFASASSPSDVRYVQVCN